MKHFGNFGTGLGQTGMTTMINPFFDLNGPFTAQKVRNVESLVAYYPAPMYPHDKKRRGMHGAPRGFVHGQIGLLSGTTRV